MRREGEIGLNFVCSFRVIPRKCCGYLLGFIHEKTNKQAYSVVIVVVVVVV